jgi:anti-sigma factor RsiW
MRPIDCNELVEIVTDYLEGTLPEAERRRFDEHLGICPGCDAYLAQMRAVLKVVGRIEPDALDPAMRDDLLAAFRGFQRRC